MSTLPTGTITFLFTDIHGSTRLWEEYPREMESVVARHDELLRSAIESHGGYVFTTAGDGFGAAFSDALDAVTAALAGQESIAGEPWGVGGFRVRMGLHTGVAHERGGERILAGGESPGDMEVLGLNRFTVLVNMETAHELRLYPPMLLLRYAEIVGQNE